MIFHQENTELDSDLAFEIKDVSVCFKAYKNRATTIKESFLRFVTRKVKDPHETFAALSHLSLCVPKGQILGIVGSNGSGKSTLLKVLGGVLVPSSGSVKSYGEIASLIELGAGFDPELTALENIYLHGALHKKTRAEIDKKVDAILQFAELNDFANTPIKYFSSGMFARLGFSAALDIDPDILIVDEILSVGDDRFQQKSSDAMRKFLSSGKTIILVSHDLTMLQSLCERIIVLSKGKIVFSGNPEEAIAKYHDISYQTALS